MAKIVIFHWRDMQHPKRGGSTQNTVHIAEHFASNGHSVIFLTEKSKEHKQPNEEINGVRYIRRGNKITQYLVLPLYFLRHLKTKTDLVIEAYDAWPFLTPMLHKKIIMLVCHIQKEEWIMEFGPILGPILGLVARFLVKLLYQRTDMVGISESTVISINELGITPKSLTKITVGVEDVMYAKNIPTKPTDRVICCTPSRLRSHKRIDLAIRTIYEYYRNTPNPFPVYFDIIGAGDHEPYLRKLTQSLNLEKHVRFYGRASDEIKRELLSRAHLHFQLSKREGWGITALEAGAQGAPTICFDILGLKDSVSEETGYIMSSVEELYREFPKIVSSIRNSDDTYTKRVTRAFQFAQQFKWSSIDTQWNQLIRQVLQSPSST